MVELGKIGPVPGVAITQVMFYYVKMQHLSNNDNSYADECNGMMPFRELDAAMDMWKKLSRMNFTSGGIVLMAADGYAGNEDTRTMIIDKRSFGDD
jgi:hypothetical protein